MLPVDEFIGPYGYVLLSRTPVMETRPLGETGHESSILTFGAIALAHLPQDEADAMVEEVLDRGVNHIDVAPTYGDAELKLAPTLEHRRDEVFLGCKTALRSYEGAREKLEASLDRLGVDRIDLYQFHGVTKEEELDEILGEDGALSAALEAREEGVIDHVGLTSHGSPAIIEEAIERCPELETVMFPMNAVLVGKEGSEYDYRSVLELADERGIGTLAIKTFAKGPWPEDVPENERPYHTWYEPFDDPDDLEECLRFTLSMGVDTLTNAGDPRLVPPILDAAVRYEEMSEGEQRAFIESRRERESPVPTHLD